MGYPEDTPEALLSWGLLALLQSCRKDGSSPTQHRSGEKERDVSLLLFAAVCMSCVQTGYWQRENSKETSSNRP